MSDDSGSEYAPSSAEEEEARETEAEEEELEAEAGADDSELPDESGYTTGATTGAVFPVGAGALPVWQCRPVVMAGREATLCPAPPLAPGRPATVAA